MKKFTVVMFEIGMFFGIIAAAFMVPRSTPLVTFGLISGTVFVLGNVFLLSKTRQAATDTQHMSAERKRRLNLIIVLFAIYWLLCFLLRKR